MGHPLNPPKQKNETTILSLAKPSDTGSLLKTLPTDELLDNPTLESMLRAPYALLAKS